MNARKLAPISMALMLGLLMSACQPGQTSGVGKTQIQKPTSQLPLIQNPSKDLFLVNELFMAKGMLLLLHFDGPAGITLFQDSSLYNHHAMCHPADCPTKAARGLDFNGRNTYLMTSANIQGLSQFTLVGWYYARSYEDAGKVPVAFYAPRADCVQVALNIGGGYTRGIVLVVADSNDCSGQEVVVAPDAPPLNEWHQIAAVYDSVTRVQMIYIDGGEVAESIYDARPIPDAVPSNPTTIGVNYSPHPSDQRWWDGYLDEIALYSRVLSAAEVHALYQAGRTTSR